MGTSPERGSWVVVVAAFPPPVVGTRGAPSEVPDAPILVVHPAGRVVVQEPARLPALSPS